MTLSEVMRYMELLSEKQLRPDFFEATRHLDHIVHMITNYPTQIGNFSQDIHSAAQEVQRSFAQVENVMLDLRSVLNKVKQNLEPQIFSSSYNLWDQEMRYETVEWILNRKLFIEPADFDIMYGHLLGYTDWRLPGMIIRPALEKWIEHLVPLDPLYIVDTDSALMQPSIASFTEEYQRRLRPYVITETNRTAIMGELPDLQFGFIFAYNYFNYKPIEVIKRYLKEIFGKLRPGGMFMFTFNDCDWSHGAALAERNFMCYTPGSMIIHEASMLGFELAYKHNGLGNVHWLELKQPGDITSLRGGQSLAKVIVKS